MIEINTKDPGGYTSTPHPRGYHGSKRFHSPGSKRGHIVADTLLLMFLGLRKLGNICCGQKMFLNKIRNIFRVPDTKFVSATNVARAGKRGNSCVGNNVSSFARAFMRRHDGLTASQLVSLKMRNGKMKTSGTRHEPHPFTNTGGRGEQKCFGNFNETW